jgi:hypothetical protein
LIGIAGEKGDTKARTKRPLAAPAVPELISGHYLLDFGYTTKGINKSKKVKLTNMGVQQVCTSKHHIDHVFNEFIVIYVPRQLSEMHLWSISVDGGQLN